MIQLMNTTILSTSQLRLKPVDAKSNTYIGSSKEINNKDPEFLIGDLLEYQNIKTFLHFKWS